MEADDWDMLYLNAQKTFLHDTNKRVFDGPKIIWLIFTFLTKLLLNRKLQQGGITIHHSELFPLTHVF